MDSDVGWKLAKKTLSSFDLLHSLQTCLKLKEHLFFVSHGGHTQQPPMPVTLNLGWFGPDRFLGSHRLNRSYLERLRSGQIVLVFLGAAESMRPDSFAFAKSGICGAAPAAVGLFFQGLVCTRKASCWGAGRHALVRSPCFPGSLSVALPPLVWPHLPALH